jgi:adenosylmethionine-8-amino-7-oxononanoate aminotransferase
MAPFSEIFWQSVRKMCTDYDVLMIVDDVAFCWGTNGAMFGYESSNTQPDICAIGKSLTAGYSPLGAAVCNEKVKSQLKQEPWDHGHTWQPNMAGVAAALEATKQIKSLLYRSSEIEQKLQLIANKLHLNHRGANTYRVYDFDREITLGELCSVGQLTATLQAGKSVKVFAPLTADDEFFIELEAGLKRIQLNS